MTGCTFAQEDMAWLTNTHAKAIFTIGRVMSQKETPTYVVHHRILSIECNQACSNGAAHTQPGFGPEVQSQSYGCTLLRIISLFPAEISQWN